MAGDRTPAENPCLSLLDVLDEEDRSLNRDNPEPDADADVYDSASAAYRLARANGDALTIAAAESAFRKCLFARLHTRRRSALCFSGGGIRSATFGLGVLQGLAAHSLQQNGERPGLLGEFDYLSTVSGGGYLGSWFSAWATRLSRPAFAKFRHCAEKDVFDGPAAVIKELSKPPESTFEPEPIPLKHLRAYSNYLSPRIGVLSSDTWALANTILRNMILNWFVLVPLFAVATLIPVLAWRLIRVPPSAVSPVTTWFLLLSGVFLGALSNAFIGYDLPNGGNAQKSVRWFVCLCFIPLTLAAIHLTMFWAWLPLSDGKNAAWWDLVSLGKSRMAWWQFGIAGAIMHGGGMAAGLAFTGFKFQRPPRYIGIYSAFAASLTGFAGGLLADLLTHLTAYGSRGQLVHDRLYACLSFPLLMGVFLFSGMLLIGATSYVTEDEDREWWAFAGGRFLAAALSWILAGFVVVYATHSLPWLNVKASAAFTALTGLSGWAAAGLAGSASTPFSSSSTKDSPLKVPPASLLKEYGAHLLLPVFLILLTMLISAGNVAALRLLNRLPSVVPSLWPEFLKPLGDASAHIFWLTAFYVALCLLASYFINVNKFSLHAMYRLRLIRAFLGASNTSRKPNLFTNFDDSDNMPMCALTEHRPLHVVNITLNLVNCRNLAWQQRKAESFTSTRLHTGSSRVGYRDSAYYGGRVEEHPKKIPITLGTAITISGAAASPNMGYHSSPLLGIVMTLFNARLGWWLGNPKAPRDLWRRPGPRFGVRPFINEALGLTDDQADWLYLSDGGHFENLGLYEMVLRRCRLIVVSDAGEDPAYTYEDLGNAIRKIRIDLGIPIEFDPPSLPMSPTGWPTSQHSGQHCAIASIVYGAVDGDVVSGTLIYMKASRNGNESPDVKQYAAAHPAFPQQPTTEQFFSESQFESYRRLGLHVIEEICGVTPDCAPQLTLSSFRNLAESYCRQRTYGDTATATALSELYKATSSQ